MNCVSVSFRTAGIDIRKQLAFDDEKKKSIAASLTGECVIICTCNRTEIYSEADVGAILRILAQTGDMEATELAPFVSFYCGEKAEEHLFRLACGIDSMIIGEDEILRQVRNAYQQSVEFKTAGFTIHTIFQSAITCAKRVKTETKLSAVPVSAATIAANEAAAFSEKAKVLVIGATGSIGSSVVKNLIAHKNIEATMTVRRHGGNLIVPDIPDAETIDYADRYKLIDNFNCIISATSSPHYVFTKERVEKNITGIRKRLFIDLAVPPDFEASIADIEGVTLLDIDHFNALAEQNNITRLNCANEAESIIDEELDVMRKKVIFHDFLPDMEKAAGFLDSLSGQKIIYMLRDELDSRSLKIILDNIRKGG